MLYLPSLSHQFEPYPIRIAEYPYISRTQKDFRVSFIRTFNCSFSCTWSFLTFYILSAAFSCTRFISISIIIIVPSVVQVSSQMSDADRSQSVSISESYLRVSASLPCFSSFRLFHNFNWLFSALKTGSKRSQKKI